MPKKCKIKSCKKPLDSLGYCGAHAQRVRRYGDPHYLTPEHIRKARQRQSLMSRMRPAKKTTYLKLNGRHMHRVVAELMLGRRLRRGEIVHHIDGNKHNNEMANLKVLTQSEHIKQHRREMSMARRSCASVRWITMEGKTMILADWLREKGVTRNQFSSRLRRGLSVSQALSP